MLIFDRRFFSRLIAEATSLLLCSATANTGKMQREQVSRYLRRAGKNEVHVASQHSLSEGQANARAAGAPEPRARRPFGRYSRLKKPQPGASAGCMNLAQSYSIFEGNARRTYLANRGIAFGM
jgi:hypothetical protein